MVDAWSDQMKRLKYSATEEVKDALAVLGFTVEVFLDSKETPRTLKELMLKVAVVAGGLP